MCTSILCGDSVNRKYNMKVRKDETLECTLGEFYKEYLHGQSQRAEDLDGLTTVFQGKASPNPRFRIRCDDDDLFFNNRELLGRFTSMGTPSQAMFVKGIRVAFAKQKMDVLEIAIPWSPSSTKRLQVRLAGGVNLELV
jgi:hypothetical protein